MTATATKLGPGTLVIGETGTTLDLSCQLSAAHIEWDKDKEDDTPVLCGEDVPGGVAYTAKLTGTVLLDLSATGMVNFTWTHKGEQFPFVFIPNTAAGQQVSGTLTVDPLDVGGDEVKKNMSVDFEWDCVGEPVFEPVGVTLAEADRAPEPVDV